VMSVAISGGVVAAAQMCMCVGRGFRFIISSFREQQLSWIGWWILFAQFGSAQSPWIGLGRMGYMCAVEGSLQKYFFGVVWCTLLTRGCARKLCVMCTLGTHRDLVPRCQRCSVRTCGQVRGAARAVLGLYFLGPSLASAITDGLCFFS